MKKTLAQSLIDYCNKNNIKYGITSINIDKSSKDLAKFLKQKRKQEKITSKLKFKFGEKNGRY